MLITEGTSEQEYVRYAVRQSHQARKGLLAIYMHNLPDAQGNKVIIGNTQFGEIERDAHNNPVFFAHLYSKFMHRWVIENGPDNLRRWVEEAAAASRRYSRG